MSRILEQIVAHKRAEVEETRRDRPLDVVQRALGTAPEVRDFAAPLQKTERIALIAEVKKASPSAGLIREDFDPVKIATIYARHGAACVSCLTDEHFFQGRLEYLTAIRRAVDVPLLRKDFIIDPYQVWEARAAGADCILLIAECLDDVALAELHQCAHTLGMQTLIEIHEPESLDRVLKLKPELLGINNRNLQTFRTDLEHSIRLARRAPDSTVLVSESGIHGPDDAVRLQNAGFHAMLVGESLMRATDLGAQVDQLLSF